MLFLMQGRAWPGVLGPVGSITTGLGKYAHGVNEGRERERRRAARDHLTAAGCVGVRPPKMKVGVRARSSSFLRPRGSQRKSGARDGTPCEFFGDICRLERCLLVTCWWGRHSHTDIQLVESGSHATTTPRRQPRAAPRTGAPGGRAGGARPRAHGAGRKRGVYRERTWPECGVVAKSLELPRCQERGGALPLPAHSEEQYTEV